MAQQKDVIQRRPGRFLEAVIETAIDAIITIDARGNIHTFNRAASRLFGYAHNEVVGRNVNILMPEPQHTAHDSYLHNYLTTRQPKIIGIGREVEGLRKDGTRFPLRLAVSEVMVEGQHYFTGVLQDLSDLKAREEEILNLTRTLESRVEERTNELEVAVNRLLEINKKLEHEIAERQAVESALRASQEELRASLEKEKELGELKSRFVSTASHEFRTPLSTILSSAALIGKYTGADQQQQREKHIERIKSSVDTLNGILNDFLSISKLESGDTGVKPEPISVEEFMLETCHEIEDLLKPGQTIEYDWKFGGEIIHSDYNMLKNILYNLVSNAIKYSDRGVIRCSAGIHDSALVMSVIDQGIGIPADDQKHLFTRFFRAANAMHVDGTGLGLNIVAGYVKLLGGDITFESEVGVGSTFTVTIPINGEHTQ